MSTFDPARFAPFTDSSRYQRSGLILVDPAAERVISQIASALPADRIDWVKQTVECLRPDQRWISQEPDDVLGQLRMVAQGPAAFAARIVEGLDFAVARWKRADVVHFWGKFVSLSKQPPHAVLIVLPTSAAFLQPSAEDLETLETQGRVLRPV